VIWCSRGTPSPYVISKVSIRAEFTAKDRPGLIYKMEKEDEWSILGKPQDKVAARTYKSMTETTDLDVELECCRFLTTTVSGRFGKCTVWTAFLLRICEVG
jgi:hypothetical protein